MQRCHKRIKLVAMRHDVTNGGESPIETKDRLPQESSLVLVGAEPGRTLWDELLNMLQRVL